MKLTELSRTSRNQLFSAKFNLDTEINEIQTYMDAFGYFEYAPLHYAAMTGDLALIQELCNNGADIDMVAPYHDQTPLTWAAQSGKASAVKLLIQLGAKLDKSIPIHATSGDTDRIVCSIKQRELAQQEATDHQKPSCLLYCFEKFVLWRELDYPSTIETLNRASKLQ